MSLLSYLPRSQTTVAILRNSDSPGFPMDMVARKLAAFAIGEPFAERKPMAVPAEQLKSAEGVYALDDKQTRTLRVKDGALTNQHGGGIGALVPLGNDRYGFPDSLTELQVERGADGKAVAVRLFNNGETEGAERRVRSGELPADRTFITLTRAQMQALVGDYSSPRFSIRVFLDDKGRLLGQAQGQPSFELLASTPRRFLVPQVGAQLDFSAEESKATSVTLTQGGNTQLMARK